ncbi:MAG: prolyl oligopeptidase family serine peptidase [Pseudomonadales bacterium]|nr:prolyl oligopeptidase family serine peptidase [Pseudomonadales bacterium]
MITIRSNPLLVLLLLLASPLSLAQPLSVESFFRQTLVRDMRISPDGSRIAMVVPTGNIDRLVVFNASDNSVLAQTVTPENLIITDLFWAGNKEVIIMPAQTRLGPDNPLITGDLFALDVDSDTVRPLVGRSARDPALNQLAYFSADQPRQAVLLRRELGREGPSERAIIGTLDLDRPMSGGRNAEVRLSNQTRSPLPRGSLYTDNAGVARLAIANEPGGDAQVRLRSGAEGEWVDISAHFTRHPMAPGAWLEFAGFAPDNRDFYYLDYGQYGTRALKRYSGDSGASTTVAEVEAFDLTLRDLVYTLAGDDIIGTRLAGDFIEASYFSEHPEVSLHQQFDATFPEERVEVLNASADRQKIVLKISGPMRVGDFVLYDTADGSLRPLTRTIAELPPGQMAVVNPFAIRNSDGLVLHGLVTLPQGSEGPLPLVVIPNELPTGVRSGPWFNRQAQFLAHNGYAVLQVNARGASGFGLAHQQAGNGQWGTGIIDDITLAVRWAVQNELTTADKVCIMGTSYGGYAAVTSLLREASRYQCAVSISGLYDLDAIGSNTTPYLLLQGQNVTEQSLGLDRAQRRAQSPLNQIAALTKPLLLIHGNNDTRAPFAAAEDFHEALLAAGKEHDWWVIEEAGHFVQDLAQLTELHTRVLAFLDSHLK